MSSLTTDRRVIAGLLAVHTIAMLAVAGLVLGWWSGSGDGAPAEGVLVPVSEPQVGPGIDGPTVTPATSLMLATATPVADAPVAAPTSTAAPPTETATVDVPTAQPSPPTPSAPAAGPADFAGRWRIIDVVTEGASTGQAFSFDVALSQDGDRISGGNSGIQMSGVVLGDTATLNYVQPALGFSGTFVWTMIAPGQAEGTFTSTAPNAGTSTAQRLP
jgi:hypothetical protein